MFSSSTQAVPVAKVIPRHIAVIMDGNGRWATARHLPRTAGHKQGVSAVRGIVEACASRGVEFLTLFAFSSENWRRPADEVSLLMSLFLAALEREVSKLHKNGIRLRVVGDISAFSSRLQEAIAAAQTRTVDNTRLTLTIAANYGGRWDLLQATRAMLAANPTLATQPAGITEALLTPHLAMAYAPEPDLFIRTGGEQRISNFLLWQLAYSELYFTDAYWPDFNEKALDAAIDWYAARERRFGRTSAQLEATGSMASVESAGA
jgi:undecaprenyl diphosphate synthase